MQSLPRPRLRRLSLAPRQGLELIRPNEALRSPRKEVLRSLRRPKSPRREVPRSPRGFDEFCGTLGGGGSYFQPPSLVRNDQVIREVMPQDFYYTDAINDEACRMIENKLMSGNEQPFFIYVAHTAPHWPLHAPKKEIDKHRGKYMKGWDDLRQKRHARLIQQKLIPSSWECSPRDVHCPVWEDKDDKTQQWEDARMATYAAQISIMDEGIGRIVESA